MNDENIRNINDDLNDELNRLKGGLERLEEIYLPLYLKSLLRGKFQFGLAIFSFIIGLLPYILTLTRISNLELNPTVAIALSIIFVVVGIILILNYFTKRSILEARILETKLLIKTGIELSKSSYGGNYE